MVRIGPVEIGAPLALAPMAGVTDLAFRTICREQGAGLTCTEMVSSKALCYQDKKSLPLLALDSDPDVKMFFKIPERFKIETPIGTCNPDGTVYLIHCGKKHFEALENGVEMQPAKSWSTNIDKAQVHGS